MKIPPIEMRTCTKCKEEKPIYEMTTRKGIPINRCRACSIKTGQEWRKKNFPTSDSYSPSNRSVWKFIARRKAQW